jgi:hypothetical protein
MRALVLLAVCLAAVGLLAAGCGGYGGSNDKPKSGTTTTTSGY